mmetsp:Transcript_1587/g.2184  ORF Transcript_1587/g.2184 Transcript_1587/m.2184 type:complete len:138 (+) Transcript_1587:240-653(+)
MRRWAIADPSRLLDQCNAVATIRTRIGLVRLVPYVHWFALSTTNALDEEVVFASKFFVLVLVAVAKIQLWVGAGSSLCDDTDVAFVAPVGCARIIVVPVLERIRAVPVLAIVPAAFLTLVLRIRRKMKAIYFVVVAI